MNENEQNPSPVMTDAPAEEVTKETPSAEAPAEKESTEEALAEAETALADAPENESEPTAEADVSEPTAQERKGSEATPSDAETDYDPVKAATLAAHPMFAYFAAGRKESFASLCRDFEKMLTAGGFAPKKEALLSVREKMTPPSDGGVASAVILSERQRRIAQSAGMSYREYRALIDTIPTAATRGGKK